MADGTARPRGAHSHAADAGFTLLELLVAILILSLIVTTLTAGVRFAGRAWSAQEHTIDRQGDSSAVETVIGQLIASAHGFAGDNASLQFVGPMPRALNRGGLFDMSLLTEGDRLVLQWTPHFTGDSVKQDPGEADLAKDVTGIDIQYYYAKDNEPAAWHATPSADKSTSPALILVRLQRSVGAAWPPLVVAPTIDAPPDSTPKNQTPQPGSTPAGAATPARSAPTAGLAN
jgi:general secretion pathway protein J